MQACNCSYSGARGGLSEPLSERPSLKIKSKAQAGAVVSASALSLLECEASVPPQSREKPALPLPGSRQPAC